VISHEIGQKENGIVTRTSGKYPPSPTTHAFRNG